MPIILLLSLPAWLKIVMLAKPLHEPRNSVAKQSRRRKSKIASCARDVRVGLAHISWRRGRLFDARSPPGRLFDQPDQAQHILGLAVAEIVDAVRRDLGFGSERRFHHAHERQDNIIDIGEIAPQLSVAENRKRL